MNHTKQINIKGQNFIVSGHLQDRMQDRGISLDDVIDTITTAKPEYRGVTSKGNPEYRLQRRINKASRHFVGFCLDRGRLVITTTFFRGKLDNGVH